MNAKQRYTPEMAVNLRIPGDPQLSPSGAQVAFVVAPIGHEATIPTSTIWCAAVDGSQPPYRLTTGTAEDKMPRWSPDGRRLAFLSDRAERRSAQVQLLDFGTGGEAHALTTLKRGLDLLAWAPDGRSLSATADRRALAGEEDPTDGIRVYSQIPRPRVIVQIPLPDGQNAESAEPAVLGPAEGHVWLYSWSPDGNQIALLTTPGNGLDEAARGVELVILNAVDHSERRLLKFHRMASGLKWSPDGTRLAVVGQTGNLPDDVRVQIVNVADGSIETVDPGETTPAAADWLTDSELLVISAEGLYGKVERVDLASKESQTLHPAPDDGVLLEPFSLCANRTTLAAVRTCATQPPEVWAGPLSGEMRCLTHLNPEIDDVDVAEMEPVEWQSSDGQTIQGWLLRPPGAPKDQPLPFLLEVHGGPTGRYSATFHGTWHDWGQIYAAAGYAVLLPNPRGSTGRGQAFTAGNRNDLGGMDFQDVMTGVDAMIERGVADPERLGVCGWSYGGYMTAWAIGHTDRFKAAIAGAAVTNWPSKIGTTDIRPGNETHHPAPFDQMPDEYWERSPIRYLGNMKTPTLIVHGAADRRVPLGQGIELYQGLKAIGVPTDLITYPRQQHGFHERACQLDLLKRMLAWWEQWLGEEEK